MYKLWIRPQIYYDYDELTTDDINYVKRYLSECYLIKDTEDNLEKEKPTEGFVNRNVKLYNRSNLVYNPTEFSARFCNEIYPLIGSGKKILDMFSGCGVVGFCFAKNNTVTCSDISEDAIKVLKINNDINVDKYQVEIIQSDVFSNITDTYDIITGVPPMMSTTEYDTKEWEKGYPGIPRIAFDAGPDELNYYVQLLEQGKNYLNLGGMIILPIKTAEQQTLIKKRLKKYPLWNYEIIPCASEEYPISILKLVPKE